MEQKSAKGEDFVPKKHKLPSSILFLCTQNAVRSPMAAGIFAEMTQNRVFIDSAGIAAKEVDGFAIRVMYEIDVDISSHVPLSIEAMSISSFDLVICFSNIAYEFATEACQTSATEIEYWPVHDPVNQAERADDQLAEYRKLRDQLQHLLAYSFEK